MKTQIMQFMRDAVTVSRAEVASHLGVSDDVTFRIAFGNAKNALVSEGIDFAPVRRCGGVYQRSDGKGSLRRSGNDRAAGIKKFTRSLDKARKALGDADTDVDTKDAIVRAVEKGDAMLGAALALNQRRRFTEVVIKIGHGNDNPRAVKKDEQGGGAA